MADICCLDGIPVRYGKLADAMPLIMAHHYTRRRTADPMLVYLLGDQAAAVITAPVNRFFGKGSVELARLVRAPGCVIPMSRFLSVILKDLKRVREKSVKFLLAYADTAADHHGGVYQACSFIYVGESKGGTMFRHKETGQLVSGRSMDQSAAARKSDYDRVPPSKKYLYVKPLNERPQKLLTRFNWQALPYPKPEVPHD